MSRRSLGLVEKLSLQITGFIVLMMAVGVTVGAWVQWETTSAHSEEAFQRFASLSVQIAERDISVGAGEQIVLHRLTDSEDFPDDLHGMEVWVFRKDGQVLASATEAIPLRGQLPDGHTARVLWADAQQAPSWGDTHMLGTAAGGWLAVSPIERENWVVLAWLPTHVVLAQVWAETVPVVVVVVLQALLHGVVVYSLLSVQVGRPLDAMRAAAAAVMEGKKPWVAAELEEDESVGVIAQALLHSSRQRAVTPPRPGANPSVAHPSIPAATPVYTPPNLQTWEQSFGVPSVSANQPALPPTEEVRIHFRADGAVVSAAAIVERWLGPKQKTLFLWIAAHDPHSAHWMRLGWSALQEGMPAEQVVKLCPAWTLAKTGEILLISYEVTAVGGAIVLRDATEQILLNRNAEMESERARIAEMMGRDWRDFQDNLEEAHRLVQHLHDFPGIELKIQLSYVEQLQALTEGLGTRRFPEVCRHLAAVMRRDQSGLEMIERVTLMEFWETLEGRIQRIRQGGEILQISKDEVVEMHHRWTRITEGRATGALKRYLHAANGRRSAS